MAPWTMSHKQNNFLAYKMKMFYNLNAAHCIKLKTYKTSLGNLICYSGPENTDLS